MRQATIGDTVQVHYLGTLTDGSEFDSSTERDPIEITLGSKQVLLGIEEALVGMSVGDTKTVTIEPDDAYGNRDPSLIHTVARTRIPDEVNLEIGTALRAKDADENEVRLMVIGLDDEKVTLDANHPLAGKALNFALKLVAFV